MLKRKTGLKRSQIKKKSSRALIIDGIENFLRAKLKKERGSICQICGRERCRPVGLFHILPKGNYPKLRFYEGNLLLVGWFTCHKNWHTNYFKAKAMESRIMELVGRDFEEHLKIIDKTVPKLTMTYLQNLLLAYKMEAG